MNFTQRVCVLSVFSALLGVSAAAQQTASPALACVAPLSAEGFARLDDAGKQKYQPIDDGVDKGKFKPRYLERVSAPGDCEGKYANPCGHTLRSTELVEPDFCTMMKAIVRSKKIKAVKPTDPAKLRGMAPTKQKSLERIRTGPDAGKLKPKYYERIKSGKSVNRFASPCGHESRSTESVDGNSCEEISNLVRSGR